MISGERLQSIAEVSLYSEMTDLISNQIKFRSQNLLKISDVSIEDIKKYKIIYIYTQFLDDFFDKFFNHLQDVVIISHNSDHGIHDKHLKYLEGNNILKWYCQNRETSHPKLVSLPIGLANSQWPHGNQELITSIRNEKNIKDILVYKNFDINTNYGERQACNIATSNNGIQLSNNTSLENYWRTLSKSVFVVSPPGNGIDCHRIWEALYLHTVPIVKYHESFTQFKHLPILFINSWEEVTISSLRDIVDEFKLREFGDIQELTTEYWKTLITNEINKAH
jgi:hypothetical protein